MLSLVISGRPVPWTAPRLGRHGNCFSMHSARKEEIRWQLRSQVKESHELWTGSVEVFYKYYFRPPKNTSAAKRRQMLEGIIHKTTNPDKDNLDKLTSDCLEGIVYKNDAQIVKGDSIKLYGEEEKTLIEVRSLVGVYIQ